MNNDPWILGSWGGIIYIYIYIYLLNTGLCCACSCRVIICLKERDVGMNGWMRDASYQVTTKPIHKSNTRWCDIINNRKTKNQIYPTSNNSEFFMDHSPWNDPWMQGSWSYLIYILNDDGVVFLQSHILLVYRVERTLTIVLEWMRDTSPLGIA